MPNTLVHIIFASIIYFICNQIGIVPLDNIIILQIFIGTTLIDLDHIIRTIRTGKPLFVKEYGLNKLAFHGWWIWIVILILLFTPLIYFALAWGLHILVDGTACYFKLDHWFITKR